MYIIRYNTLYIHLHLTLCATTSYICLLIRSGQAPAAPHHIINNTCMYVYMYIYIYIYVYIHMCVYIYIYTYI